MIPSSSNRSARGPVSSFTWLGLTIALFSLMVVREFILHLYPTLPVAAVVARESFDWVSMITLVVIIRRGEHLPFSSVGLGTARWLRSLGWGIVLTVALIIAGTIGEVIGILTHYQSNQYVENFTRLPLWLIIVTCVRGGVVEELFYRGYAIERLRSIGLNRFWATMIPVLIFSLGHWNAGWLNVVNAFLLGSVLSTFYIWRRDLVANMIGHFLINFITVFTG
jgi:membrane protease YdiL (CAAX protease family)